MQVFVIQPARSGRQNRSGVRQSIPSISIASCAGDSVTELPGSANRGQKKFPWSIRLVNRHSPVPSQNKIFRSEAFLPRKMNKWPENGNVARHISVRRRSLYLPRAPGDLAKILWHDGVGVHLALGVVGRGVDLGGPDGLYAR